MADEQVVDALESKATPEQQAEASKIGWIPPERFKGNSADFVDADEYIKRGETVLPIVKKALEKERGENATLRAEQAKLAAALKEAQDAIEQIEERHTVATQRAVEKARAEVKAQLAKASEDGDHEAVAELTDQLTQLNTAETKAEKKAEKAAAPAPYVPPPELKAWNEDNEWFGKDKRRTALALGIAQELRDAGETSQGRPFFDKVAAEVEKTMNPQQEARGDKVEGANHGGGESRANGKKGYIHLPADAKAACDADARQFVGPTKKYKDITAWRQRYAEIYFEQGA